MKGINVVMVGDYVLFVDEDKKIRQADLSHANCAVYQIVKQGRRTTTMEGVSYMVQVGWDNYEVDFNYADSTMYVYHKQTLLGTFPITVGDILPGSLCKREVFCTQFGIVLNERAQSNG